MLRHIVPRLPQKIGTYGELMVGAGAVFIELARLKRFESAIISDSNAGLMNAWRAVKENVDALVVELRRPQYVYERSAYLQIRAIDPSRLSKAEAAARFIYLNRTCFTPGSLVLMEDETTKPIESVEIGDRLWGGRVVQETLKRQYVGTVRRINVVGSPYTASVTADHPMLSNVDEEPFTLQQANNLSIGKNLALPTVGTLEGDVDWSQFWPKEEDLHFNCRLVSFTPNDDDMAKLIGYYAAEGHIFYGPKSRGYKNKCPKGVTFTFGWVEDHLVGDVMNICHRLFGKKPSLRRSRNTASLSIHSAQIARFVSCLVPGQTRSSDPQKRYTKRLNPIILTANQKTQLNILKAWMSGGLRKRSNNRNELYGTCSAKLMARQLYRIAQRCQLKPSWRTYYPHGFESAIISFHGFDITKFGYDTSMKRKKSSSKRKVVSGLMTSSITEIIDIEYDGIVFNLEVDGDHLICVDGIISHNCFNGLHRVNSSGQFNVPFGRYTDPVICDEPNLRAVSALLAGVKVVTADAAESMEAFLAHPRGEFVNAVYVDPPYIPISKTSSFVSYTEGGFSMEDHVELGARMSGLAKAGVRVVTSNSSSPAALEILKDFDVDQVTGGRSVAGGGGNRKSVQEIVAFAGPRS